MHVTIGAEDLTGPVGVLTFEATDRLKQIQLAPLIDDEPEINETFILEIYSSKDIIGTPAAVSVTILANDDWNGVFSFTDSSLSLAIGKLSLPLGQTYKICPLSVVILLLLSLFFNLPPLRR